MPKASGGIGKGPDFICVGAQKAGTQWLYDQLAFHPDFWMPPVKELHFFDLPGSRVRKARKLLRRAERKGETFNRRRARQNKRPLAEDDLAFLRSFIDLPEGDIEAYADLFDCRGGRLCGDITPGYSGLTKPVIGRIADRFPDVKAIYIARNPIDRFWSAFNMRLRRGDIGESRDVDALRAFAARKGVKRRSSPSTTVRRWRKVLPPDQFALCFFEDVIAHPDRLRRDILTFLGASAEANLAVPSNFNRKSNLQKFAMNDVQRQTIADIFKAELEACAEELGGPAVGWADAYRA